jgi:hypothetical protein
MDLDPNQSYTTSKFALVVLVFDPFDPPQILFAAPGMLQSILIAHIGAKLKCGRAIGKVAVILNGRAMGLA